MSSIEVRTVFDSDCYVYWIRSADMSDIFTEGYVGVSYDPRKRLRQHIREARTETYYRNADFKHLLLSDFESIILDVVFSGKRTDCLQEEARLRPRKYVGWNVKTGGAVGAGSPHDLKYSEVLDIYDSLRGWEWRTGIKQNTISCSLARGHSLDQSIGLAPKEASECVLDDLDDPDKNTAIFLLESTLMPALQIARQVGFNSDLKRVLKRRRIPNWLYSHSDVTLSAGHMAVRLPRNAVITDHEIAAYIYEECFCGLRNEHSLSKEVGIKYGAVRNFVKKCEGAKLIS